MMRASEWISVAGFAGFLMLALTRRGLGGARRARIAALGTGGAGATLICALVLPRMVSPFAAEMARELLPCILILVFYSMCGQFVTGADEALEARLARLDRRLVMPPLEWCARRPLGVWILNFFELAYLLYYLIPPAMSGMLLLTGGRRADHFWTVVLLAAYSSCGMLAFIQTRPPRALEAGVLPPKTRLRAFNLWILHRGSIGANTFPSAHVATATGCALALLWVGPWPLGAALLAAAGAIALGAVAGRYHYAADAILGFVFAGASLVAAMTLAQPLPRYLPSRGPGGLAARSGATAKAVVHAGGSVQGRAR